MPSIIDRERDLYDTVWQTVDNYRTHSAVTAYMPIFREILGEGSWGKGTMLDAGCGTGEGGLLLADEGFHVRYCDLSDEGLDPRVPRHDFVRACLWHDLRRSVDGFVDYVYCCDVLEHIPPALTMLVTRRLLEVARTGVFLVISTVPDLYASWAGEPLHKTVEPFTWWRDHLKEIGTVVEARDLLVAGIYYLEP